MADEGQVLTMLSTEHFGLAGARSQASSETATRSALYLGSVSSTLVGLGLTSQVSKGTDIFDVFALVALPTLFVLGVFTFVRLVELGIEDFLLGPAVAVGAVIAALAIGWAVRFQVRQRGAGTDHPVLFPSQEQATG